jgi:hypothetical protein
MSDALVRKWALTIGLDQGGKLIAWVASARTLPERKRRAAVAKRAMGLVLEGVDHEAFNKAVRDQAHRFTGGEPN